MLDFIFDLFRSKTLKYSLQVKRKSMSILGQWYTYEEHFSLNSAIEKAKMVQNTLNKLGFAEMRIVDSDGKIVWTKK